MSNPFAAGAGAGAAAEDHAAGGGTAAATGGDDLAGMSYIEMMCASPRSDNAAARSILKPEAAATDEEKREVSARRLEEKRRRSFQQNLDDVRKALRTFALGGELAGRPPSLEGYILEVASKKKVFAGLPAQGDGSRAKILPPLVTLDGHSCRGFLVKQGGMRKNWLERWFVLDLRAGRLTYYSDMTEQTVKGEMSVRDITSALHLTPGDTKEASTRAFSIITSGRTFNVRAETVDVMNIWIEIINVIANDGET